MKRLDAETSLRLASATAVMNLSVSDSISGAASFEETMKLDSRFSRRAVG
jgi:hypothetical protein